MMRRQGDEESRAFYDLSALTQISHPSGFASLLLGISVALMLCGSLTFFIGFLLLPWVLALIIVFYVAGIVSAISIAWRSIHALLRLDASSLLHKGDFCFCDVASETCKTLYYHLEAGQQK
ncbi:hypothetical protein HID58_066022 [Brassica napus]|uniref:Uncharacterized protein n=1 Tax=Brassica napus TaxID=3708 RepID=A0ABQ7ZEJ6_BRANA|nr:hypothetical protein HID58_066022 [Brassica napus]